MPKNKKRRVLSGRKSPKGELLSLTLTADDKAEAYERYKNALAKNVTETVTIQDLTGENVTENISILDLVSAFTQAGIPENVTVTVTIPRHADKRDE